MIARLIFKGYSLSNYIFDLLCFPEKVKVSKELKKKQKHQKN